MTDKKMVRESAAWKVVFFFTAFAFILGLMAGSVLP